MLMVKQMSGVFETGLYGSAYNIFIGVTICSNVIIASIFPRIANSGPLKRLYWIKRGTTVLIVLSILFIGTFYVFSERLLNIVYGGMYNKAYLLLHPLVFATIFMFPNNLMNYLIILAGKEKSYAIVVFAGLVFNISANWVAIYRWKAMGAAYTTVLTEFLLFVCMAALVKRNWKEILNAHRG
jgi:O-antigen/teichoic acid export membrane protein